jgi:hypothetical protein
MLLHIPSCAELFLGVFAANQVQETLHKAPVRSFCFANTDHSSERGSHWYVIFKISRTVYETFDSLGQTRETAEERVGAVGLCYFNISRVQAEESKSCGKFSLYFCVTRLLNYEEPFAEVFSDCFTSNLELNEHIVDRFWESGKLYDASEDS